MPTISSKGKLNIGYKGKMFDTPKCEYELSHALPEGESPEETKLLVAAFKKLFTKEFQKLAKIREKAIKSAMEGTEKDWTKKPPSNIGKAVKIANTAISQGVKNWKEVEIPRLADECIANTYAYMEKKLKKKINKKKAKTVLKIVVLVLIVVAAAAVTIATAGLAAPLAGGITAAVVIGMIGTGGTALFKSGKIIKKEYDNYNSFLSKIEADIKAIEKAVAYQEKKKGLSKLGPKERVKLMMSGTKAHVKSLEKHLKAAEARMILARAENKKVIEKSVEAADNWAKMAKHPNSKVSGEAAKAQDLAIRTASKAKKVQEQLDAFNKVKTEAKALLASMEKKGEFTSDKFGGAINFAQKHQEFATQVATGGQTLFKLGKKMDGVLKAIG